MSALLSVTKEPAGKLTLSTIYAPPLEFHLNVNVESDVVQSDEPHVAGTVIDSAAEQSLVLGTDIFHVIHALGGLEPTPVEQQLATYLAGEKVYVATDEPGFIAVVWSEFCTIEALDELA